MTRDIFALSSFANIVGGTGLLVLVATGAVADPPHAVPVIAIAIGGVLLVQGFFSFGYAQRWWGLRGAAASGALLGGQLIAICAGLATIAYAIVYVPRAANGGVEPGPFFAGAAIEINALLALLLLASIGALRRKTRGRAAT